MAGNSEANQIELPGLHRLGGPVRAVFVLAGFLALTLPLMPIQAVLLRLAPRLARRVPHLYHRAVCRLIGIRLHVDGEIPRDSASLIVANHVSWLDIPVMSAVAPLSFIAKREVGTWPFVSSLAKLQRTVFVDRERRTQVGSVAAEMTRRLENQEALVLFAEGTSTDGNRVLPFKSALFAAAVSSGVETSVQPLSIVYTHLHGIPLGRADRSLIGWYGDMEMAGHAWQLLKAGPIDVRISLGEPVSMQTFETRKAVAQHAEHVVRSEVVRMMRGRDET